MKIRRLDDKDAVAYWTLHLEALRSEPLAFGRDAEEYEAAGIDEQLRQLCEMPEHDFILGGFADGILVAIASFTREPGLKERHKGHIRGLYVTSGHRGKGLGQALFAAMLAEIKQDRCAEQILLGVSDSQGAALKMYRDFGFVVYGTEPRALRVGDRYVDEHQMILLLGLVRRHLQDTLAGHAGRSPLQETLTGNTGAQEKATLRAGFDLTR